MVTAPRTVVGGLDAFRFHLLAGNKSPATIKNYVQCASTWMQWSTEHEVEYWTDDRNVLMAYLGQRSAAVAPSTLRLEILSLRVFYDFLIETRIAKTNPARSIKVGKQVARPVEPFSQDELQRMFHACRGARERACFLLLLGGGLRRSEVATISKSDVNFAAGTVRIWGKGRKYRLIRPGGLAL